MRIANIFHDLPVAKSIPLHWNRPTYSAYNAQFEISRERDEVFF